MRGIAKAQLFFLATNPDGTYGAQTTENEMPPANLWSGPVAVSVNQNANPQTAQDASATLANPSSTPITVRGTLSDLSGNTVTFKDFQIPASATLGIVFSWGVNDPSEGFGNAMFPSGQDFNGLVTFQVISPNGGTVSAAVYQFVGSTMSSVQLNSAIRN